VFNNTAAVPVSVSTCGVGRLIALPRNNRPRKVVHPVVAPEDREVNRARSLKINIDKDIELIKRAANRIAPHDD